MGVEFGEHLIHPRTQMGQIGLVQWEVEEPGPREVEERIRHLEELVGEDEMLQKA